MKIIFDADFLLVSVRFRVDIFSELNRICNFNYSLYTLDKVLDELKGKKEEKIVRELINSKKVSIIKTEKNKNADDLILDLVDGDKFIVATQDKELKQRLEKKRVKIITIRNKKYLEIKG